jgi:HEAT repeat protein
MRGRRRQPASVLRGGVLVIFALTLHGKTAPEWLDAVRAAKGAEKTRLLLGYRELKLSPDRDGPLFVSALADPDVGVRSAAAIALGDLGWTPAGAVRGLIHLLEDPGCRFYAAAALMKLHDEDIVPPLLELLRDPDRVFGLNEWHFQSAASQGTKNFRCSLLAAAYILSGRPVSTPALMELAGRQEGSLDWGGRAANRYAFRQVGNVVYDRMALGRMDQSAMEDELVHALEHDRPSHETLLQLMSEGRFSNLRVITRLLNSADPELAVSAAYVLSLNGEEGQRLLKAAADAGNQAAKRPLDNRATQLRITPDVNETVFLSLVSALNSGEFVARSSAIARFADEWAQPIISPSNLPFVLRNLRSALQSHRDTVETVFNVMTKLGKQALPLAGEVQTWLRQHATDEPLSSADIDCAKHARNGHLCSAVEALQSIGPASSQVLENGSLQTNDEHTVLICTRVLERWTGPSPRVLGTLAAVAETGGSEATRSAALHFLADAGPPGLTHIRRLAAGGPELARSSALMVLGSVGEPGDLRQIVRALSSTSGLIHRAALISMKNALSRTLLPEDESKLLRDAEIDAVQLAERLVQVVKEHESKGDLSQEFGEAILAILNRLAFAVEFNSDATHYTIGAIIADARRSGRACSDEVNRILSAVQSQTLVKTYLDECTLQDRDQLEAISTDLKMFRSGKSDSRSRLYELALRRLQANNSTGPLDCDSYNGKECDSISTSFRIIDEIGLPFNSVDPLVETKAIERYVGRLLIEVAFDEAFLGESRSEGGPNMRQDAWAPEFAWPPPVYSERDRITDLFGPRERMTLGEIDDRLTAALIATGYGTGGLYRIQGGFLRVSKLEQLNSDRTQAPQRFRFEKSHIPPQGLMDYLAQLFLARPGIFRSILFAVTSAPVTPDPESPRLTEESASGLYLGGTVGRLPDNLRDKPLEGRECYVLIYEFEKKAGVSSLTSPSPLSARDHLSRAGILGRLAIRRQ